MTALVVALTVVVALLAIPVAGLLRSHADILRAPHPPGITAREQTARTNAEGLAHAAHAEQRRLGFCRTLDGGARLDPLHRPGGRVLGQ